MRIFLAHLLLVQISISVILRINEFGLHEAANFTRQWLSMAGPHFRIPELKQVFHNSIAYGEMSITNTSVIRFVPPLIRFRPSDHSIIYMSTLSGYAQVSAEWSLTSQVFNIVHVPLRGEIYAQMTGLISEIAMQITPENDIDVHHCVAQIRDLRLTLKGSMAADVLHWFRTTLTRAIRRKLEDEYCRVMKSSWLPWVEAQLGQFPTNLTISNEPKVVLVQSLQSIAMTQQYIDLRMRSDLMWNGAFIESAPVENTSLTNIETFSRSTRMIDMFVNEQTVQSILAAAHFAGHLKTTLDSPFLSTYCDVLCVGTVLPELAETLPNRTLKVKAATLSPPIIILQTGRAVVFLNASLEVFSAPKVENITGSILSINVETKFILTMEMRNRKVKGYVNMVNAQASLVESRIGMMSQKTIDFLVNMSTPFLEDAIDLFIGGGLFIGDPFQFPSTNEHLSINENYIRWEADLAIPALMQRTRII